VAVSLEPEIDQARQRARVIDVRVAEHHRVELAGVNPELAVDLVRLGATPLVEAAVQQDPAASRVQNVHRAGDRACCADELDVHARTVAAVGSGL
jgi:hypothetical protein